MEGSLWPAMDCGCVSIYCASHYAVGRAPGFHAEDRGWGTWGALALVFSNPAARAFLSSGFPVGHRHHGPRLGARNIDCVVGAWCKHASRPFYVFTPSLAEHVGYALNALSTCDRDGLPRVFHLCRRGCRRSPRIGTAVVVIPRVSYGTRVVRTRSRSFRNQSLRSFQEKNKCQNSYPLNHRKRSLPRSLRWPEAAAAEVAAAGRQYRTSLSISQF